MQRSSWMVLLAALACAGSGGSSESPLVLQAGMPAFSPPGGTYASAQQVTVASATPGATVRCTVDGSAPTAASPACTSLEVAETTTVRAVSIAPGYTDSGVASATYTIAAAAPIAAAPTFSPPGGTYASAQQVTVSSATAGATVRCTLDGTPPTAATPACASPVNIPATATLRAIATADGFAPSAAASATYTIETPAPVEASPPTFSPPGGTYASAQQVTVSSATPGATVRCTLDGTPPTAATAACASPVNIPATATLRAIATADGFAPSAVRAATYTIQASPPTDPTLAQKLQALASKRQLLAHQSVGNNILYGNGTGGLDGLLDANPGSGVTIAYHPASAAAVPVGAVADTAIGVNGQPVGKVLDFDAQVRTRFGGALDYFGFKFCFTDIWTAQDVSDTWAQYQATMDALEAAYPGKIIYWTVPLMPDVTDIDGNTQREALSNHIREKYGGTGRVFDLAYHESHDAQGNPFTLGGVPALAHDWSADGGHDAHLNAAGATMVATRWVEFMYRVATGAAP